jgi:predicted transcriptional regulator of viral defense system
MNKPRFITPKTRERHELARQVKAGQLQRVARGVYTSASSYEAVVVSSLAHPQAILTLKTALQIYGLSDSFPLAPFDLAFKAGSRKSLDPNLHQYFISSALFPLGETIYKWEGYSLAIYDKERLLIEIFRFRKRLDPDTYKRAIFFYRDLANSNRFLSSRFEEYAQHFPNKKELLRRLEMEVL